MGDAIEAALETLHTKMKEVTNCNLRHSNLCRRVTRQGCSTARSRVEWLCQTHVCPLSSTPQPMAAQEGEGGVSSQPGTETDASRQEIAGCPGGILNVNKCPICNSEKQSVTKSEEKVKIWPRCCAQWPKQTWQNTRTRWWSRKRGCFFEQGTKAKQSLPGQDQARKLR